MKKLMLSLASFFVIAVVILYLTSHLILAGVLSGVIGAPVNVGRVHIGTSDIGIYGLVIRSPKGFEEKRLASVPEISVQYDLGAFFKGRVHLQRIHINMEEVTIERNSAGKFNLLEINALKKPSQDKAQPPEPSKPSEPSKPAKAMPLQIDEVVLDLDKARYVDSNPASPSSKEFNLGVKNEIFRDVTYTPTLIRQLVFFILKKVGMSAFPANLDTLLKGVGGEAGTTVAKWMDKLNQL